MPDPRLPARSGSHPTAEPPESRPPSPQPNLGPTIPPPDPEPPSLVAKARHQARRVKHRLARLRAVVVRQVDWRTVRVRRRSRLAWPRLRLDESAARYRLRAATLVVDVPDPAALTRLAVSGQIGGTVRALRVRLTTVPDWVLQGLRPPRVTRETKEMSWRRRGGGLELRFRWSAPYEVEQALSAALATVVRARGWDQISGPVYALDRTAWLDGTSSWPQGRLTAAAPELTCDAHGRPLGPLLAPEPSPNGAAAPVVLSAVANPFGRRLFGEATHYRLVGGEPWRLQRVDSGLPALRLDPRLSAEAAALAADLDKYAVVSVEEPVPDDEFLITTLRSLGGCGVVFAATDPGLRSRLADWGLVTVADPGEVEDLRGYALSVAAARQIAITGDAALRRTALNGDGAVPLPTVSVVLSSMRAEHIDSCLGYLAAQTYPAMEVVVGLHGYDVSDETRERWRARLPCPLRVRSFPPELSFGAVLGQLSRIADGELVTKVDDDDRYGRHHVTDLVIALHTSGADLAAKGSRFVHLPEAGETIDRAWAAPELFNVTPAGGTLLLPRSTLAQVGGWSHSSKHVDTDLLKRIRGAGGLVYRTHALEYVYVRRSTGHTWLTDLEEITSQSERIYPGLPSEILDPDYSSVI